MAPVQFSVVSNCDDSNNGPRLGSLKKSESKIDTPMFMLYTKYGSIPHVSREVFEKIIPNEQVLFNFPLSSNMNFYEPVKEFKHGLIKFVGLENYLSCCSIMDSVLDTPRGKNQKDKVSIKTKSGNKMVDYEKYMDIIEVFKPNMYVTLSMSDTDWNSSPSVIEKSVNVSNRLFKSCLERHHQSEILKESGIIAPIQGGYDIQERIRSATFLSEYNDLLGFLFDGFYTDGSIVEDIPSDLIIPIVNKTMECLPNDKMKIIFGAWTPSTIIDLINSGMDVFDSSFPFLATKRNSALIFDYDLKFKNDIIMNSLCCTADENNVVKLKSYDCYEICLKDTSYFDDFKPIKDACTCLTCRKHTRSYIHHLLMSNEILGPILLTIHNLHYFHQFFKNIREVLLNHS